MALFCTHCGNEVNENAVVCLKCGCAISNQNVYGGNSTESNSVVDMICQRIKVNAVIWIIIGIIQIVMGVFINWIVLIVGFMNIMFSIINVNNCQAFRRTPIGIVKRMKPLAGPIITLVYNLLFGGVIGIIGSIYYLVAVRGYVCENEQVFNDIENEFSSNIIVIQHSTRARSSSFHAN